MKRDSLDNDIKKALDIVKETGVKRFILFGSCTIDPSNAHDIDFALSGVPKGMFFRLMGRLIKELKSPIDVVDLDVVDEYLKKRIIENGKVLYESRG